MQGDEDVQEYRNARARDAFMGLPDDGIHTRGEFVLGLGWSCVDCDTFYCAAVNGEL